MAEEIDAGCTRPESNIAQDASSAEKNKIENTPITKEVHMIKVGQKAPDFTAAAYHKGKFINVKLSDSLGKWVVLCFYPGDFTFV